MGFATAVTADQLHLLSLVQQGSHQQVPQENVLSVPWQVQPQSLLGNPTSFSLLDHSAVPLANFNPPAHAALFRGSLPNIPCSLEQQQIMLLQQCQLASLNAAQVPLLPSTAVLASGPTEPLLTGNEIAFQQPQQLSEPHIAAPFSSIAISTTSPVRGKQEPSLARKHQD